MELTPSSIKSRTPKELHNWLNALRQHFEDVSIYLYGSAVRGDYLSGRSDIDLCIFTDSPSEVKLNVCMFFHEPLSKFRHVVWKLNGSLIYGSKLRFHRPVEGEVSVYSLSQKDRILEECRRGFTMGVWSSILLTILKFVYYTLHLISSETYKVYKRYIFNVISYKKESAFLLV